MSNATGLGHNSGANDQLRLFIERIERLDEEKKGISDDIKDVFSEAKGQGFDTKVMRYVLAQRRIEQAARDEFRALAEVYLDALGLL